MNDLTPAMVSARLANLSRELQNKVGEIPALQREANETGAAYKSAHAKAYLQAEGTIDERKAIAYLETEYLLIKWESAKAVLSAARDSIRLLKDQIKIGQSIGSIVKMEWHS